MWPRTRKLVRGNASNASVEGTVERTKRSKFGKCCKLCLKVKIYMSTWSRRLNWLFKENAQFRGIMDPRQTVLRTASDTLWDTPEHTERSQCCITCGKQFVVHWERTSRSGFYLLLLADSVSMLAPFESTGSPGTETSLDCDRSVHQGRECEVEANTCTTHTEPFGCRLPSAKFFLLVRWRPRCGFEQFDEELPPQVSCVPHLRQDTRALDRPQIVTCTSRDRTSQVIGDTMVLTCTLTLSNCRTHPMQVEDTLR